jgi:CubicO group peptidase (beta-lactamase class C family)
MSDKVSLFKDAVPLLDDSIRKQIEKLKIPVLALAAYAQGETILDRVYRLHDSGEDSVSPPLFHMGSMSKMYTGTAVHASAERGKLRLSDKAAAYLPTLQCGANSLFRQTTLDHLMLHQGVPPFKHDIHDRKLTFSVPSNEAALIRAFVNSKAVVKNPDRPPVIYSQTMAFSLLGNILVQVHGKPFPDIIRQTILRKLGLKDTFPSLQDIPLERRKDVVPGHSDGLEIAPRDFGTGSPSLGFIASARDVAHFFDSLCEGHLLSQAHTKRLHEYAVPFDPHICPWKSGYGVQHYVLNAEGQYATGHGGFIPGYTGFVARHDKLTICCLINVNNRLPGHPRIWPYNFVLCLLRDLLTDQPVQPPRLNFTRQKYFGWAITNLMR